MGGVLGDQDAGRAPLGPLGALLGGGPGVVLAQQADVVLLAELRQLPALGLQLLAQRLQDFADLGEETKRRGGSGVEAGHEGGVGGLGELPPRSLTCSRLLSSAGSTSFTVLSTSTPPTMR